jgi:uncharacterized membrane protein YjfL (UPF0719 family)
MVPLNPFVVTAAVLGYLVSILASAALVLLFFRVNSRLLPDCKMKELSLAPAIALGAATLSEAFLLRHAIFLVMALVEDFLATYGNRVFSGDFPFGPFLRQAGLAILLFSTVAMLSVLSIWIAGAFFDRMTRGIDEISEIAQGNVPVAVLFAFALLAITVLLNEGIGDISRALIPSVPGLGRIS